MTAVVRLKRHLEEEPLSAVILNCKRRKKSTEQNDDETTTVLKFAGTLNNQEDDISSHISKLTKEELKESYKNYVPNTTSKLRKYNKEASNNNRYKVVSLFRSDQQNNKEDLKKEDDKIPLTVLDVEPETSANSEKNRNESDYVYDIYYTDSDDIYGSEGESYHVCPANEIIFDPGNEDAESLNDSDDSNAENNWRNDYPEEEEDECSIDEDDMRDAIERLSLKDDLSSDDGEEGFVYSVDSEAAGFEEDVDDSDVRRYGELYARFKARQKKEEERYNKDLYHDEIDDTDEDFY